ncbi:hypothetical protein AAVH_27305 [Aphelenchoides avenae]|nr:hypothetical protein AAVH_27305 [Aphelenchus avenae]
MIAVHNVDIKAVMELALRVANVVLCSIIAFILNMVIVAMFIVYRRYGRMQTAQKGQDVRLFIHSLLMFLVQACLALQRVVEMTDYYSFVSENTEITGFGHWLPDWLKVDSTRWLAGDDGCFNGDDLKNAYKGQRPCGLLYLTLCG